MTQREKRVKKLMSASKTMTWSELVSAMSALGYEVQSKKSSHFDFYNEKEDRLIKEIPKPHGGNKHVKVVYLKKIKSFLNQA